MLWSFAIVPGSIPGLTEIIISFDELAGQGPDRTHLLYRVVVVSAVGE